MPGQTPETPKRGVQNVIDTYDLEPGDTIFIDTGTYELSSQIPNWSDRQWVRFWETYSSW